MFEILILLIPLILSSAIVLYCLPKIMFLSVKNKILDDIDIRKVHTSAACRLGGASFLPAIVLSVFTGSIILAAPTIMSRLECGISLADININLPINSLSIIGSMMTLYFVGIYDDIIGVRYKNKFIFQFATALIIILSGTYISNFNGLLGIDSIPSYAGMILTILLIVYITNAINLIDGIDGLASMLSIIAFAMYATMFYLNKNYVNCIFCVSALGTLLPFWHHNVFGIRKGATTKIFMGDGGSLVIGFLLSVMTIELWNCHDFEGAKFGYISDYSWVAAFTVLIIPCFDVIKVIILRASNKKPLFEPDKNHIHHNLMSLGITARKSLLVLFFINILFLSINYALAIQHVDITIIALVDIVLWVVVHFSISRIHTKREGKKVVNEIVK